MASQFYRTGFVFVLLMSVLIGVGADTSAAEGEDIAFTLLVDTTGSMGGAIDSIKDEAVTIPDSLAAAFPGGWSGRLTEFRDDVTPVLDWTSDADAFVNATQTLSAAAGGDAAEAWNTALRGSLTSGFPAASCRIALVVTDAPSHPDDHAAIAQMYRDEGIIVAFVRVGNSSSALAQMANYRITGGDTWTVPGDGAGLAVAVRLVLERCGASLDVSTAAIRRAHLMDAGTGAGVPDTDIVVCHNDQASLEMYAHRIANEANLEAVRNSQPCAGLMQQTNQMHHTGGPISDPSNGAAASGWFQIIVTQETHLVVLYVDPATNSIEFARNSDNSVAVIDHPSPPGSAPYMIYTNSDACVMDPNPALATCP